MSTYLLFADDDYYPGGGMCDCRGVFACENDDEAVARALLVFDESSDYDNWELVQIVGEDWREVPCDFKSLTKARRIAARDALAKTIDAPSSH